MQLSSWRTYENYTGPLGLQTLTDIVGNHYGVAVEASERNGWGQWHRADDKGVGMDRTMASGTGYVGQYRPEVQKQYESLGACPDDLLLFMHHVPYTHVLHDGTTVIQYIYDSHYDGADAVAGYVRDVENTQRPDRRRAISAGPRSADISGRPGDRLARRGVDVVLSRRLASPIPRAASEHYSRPQGSGDRAAGRVRRETCHALGNGVGWPGGRMRCGACTATFTYDEPPGGGI